MKNLLIVGAGGYGREIASAAPFLRGFGEAFVVKGFLDRRPEALDGFTGYPPVVGDPDAYAPAAEDVFFVAIGSSEIRRRVVAALASRGARFQTLVHGTATLGANVTLGEGCYIAHHAVLTADIRVGEHAFVFQQTVIGHDCRLGAFANVFAQVFLGGGVEVGAGASLCPGAKVAPFRKIGANATVGLGSAVVTNVREGTTVFGVPALEQHYR